MRERHSARGSRYPMGRMLPAPRLTARVRARLMTALAAAGLALASVTVVTQDVTYDYDRSTAFATFKTYSWVRGTPVGDQANDERIVRAIDVQLRAKGLTKIDTGVPDLLVAYHASFDRDLQIAGFSSGWGNYRFAGPRSGSAQSDTLPVGTLTVDLIAARSRMIVWRGQAIKQIDVHASASTREANINAVAVQMFNNYPPPR